MGAGKRRENGTGRCKDDWSSDGGDFVQFAGRFALMVGWGLERWLSMWTDKCPQYTCRKEAS